MPVNAHALKLIILGTIWKKLILVSMVHINIGSCVRLVTVFFGCIQLFLDTTSLSILGMLGKLLVILGIFFRHVVNLGRPRIRA